MRVELQLSQLSLEKMVSLPTFIRTEIVSGGSPLTGHLFFWNIWGAWAAMAQRCHPRQCTLRIYLWEGFWNGFLLGQACEVPATARGNHFRPFVCLDSLDMLICCTGTGLLVEEPKMAKTVSADRIITEIHWHWVVPAPPGQLAGFNLSQPTNTVSIISKTFEDYQILSNNTRGIL